MTFFGIPAIILQSRETKKKKALCALSLGGVTHQGHIFIILSLNWGWRFKSESRNIYRFTWNAPWGPHPVNWLTIGCGILGMGLVYLQLLMYGCGLPQDRTDTAGGEKVLDCKEEKESKGEALGGQM